MSRRRIRWGRSSSGCGYSPRITAGYAATVNPFGEPERLDRVDRVTATSLGDGELIGAVIMYQDVTQQHRAEDQIREQAMLLDQAEGNLCSRYGGSHRVLDNRDTRLHGWSALKVLGRRAQDFLYADLVPVEEALAILLQSGVWRGEMTNLAKDGRKRVSANALDSRSRHLRQTKISFIDQHRCHRAEKV